MTKLFYTTIFCFGGNMKLSRIALGLALAGLSFSANATNGYFSHGYGMKAKGMAGASTTNTDDAFFGANNPAAAAFVGNRIDLGVDLFSPRREASRTGSAGFGDFPPLDFNSKSDSNYFAVPEFGYNRMMNNNLALGITVYGNGGMNSDYPAFQNVCSGMYGGADSNGLCGMGRLGVDLMQLIVAPTAAYKIAPNHSIGISPLVGYQRFKAEGLHAFTTISSDPANVTNNGYDDAFGYGVRVGYLGKITPTVSIGAAYASKMKFDEFKKYAGLFAEQGGFDIPENYNIGASWQATSALRLALDYQRIKYSGVRSVANPILPAAYICYGSGTDLATGACLGQDGGSGFGWQDMDVWKLGAEYKYNSQWTFRAGYSHTDQPIPSQDVEFNIIAPAVVEDHVTLGFTYTRANGDEVTAAYMHAFQNSVSGPSVFFNGVPGANVDTIKMYENSLGIQYSWKM
jgi:long-chain fatty acid transport protein